MKESQIHKEKKYTLSKVKVVLTKGMSPDK